MSRAAFAFIANAGLSGWQEAKVGGGEAALVVGCMHTAGFEYHAAVPAVQEPWRAAVSLYTFDGKPPNEVRSLATRRTFGYGLAAPTISSAVARAEAVDQSYFAHLPKAAQARYLRQLGENAASVKTTRLAGIEITYDPVGCHAQAEAEIFGSALASNWVNVVGAQLFATAARLTAVSYRVISRTRAWARCMQQATGERYRTPTGPLNMVEAAYARLGRTFATETLERRTAVADDQCQYASGLAAVYSAAFHAAVLALPREKLALAISGGVEVGAATRRALGFLARSSPL